MKYVVIVNVIERYRIEIDSDSEQDAIDKAEDIAIGEHGTDYMTDIKFESSAYE